MVKKAELIDYSSVKGCMILRPAGYAIWENIQHELDRRFKETGVENVYLPLFIPESLLAVSYTHLDVYKRQVVERGTIVPPTYIKPLAGGRFTSGFGRRWGRMHKGVDWACPIGTTVYASCAGTVIQASYNGGYGNNVVISHADGRLTRYAHNSLSLIHICIRRFNQLNK